MLLVTSFLIFLVVFQASTAGEDTKAVCFETFSFEPRCYEVGGVYDTVLNLTTVYTFNGLTGECESRSWKGCNLKGNMFMTMDQCINICLPTSTATKSNNFNIKNQVKDPDLCDSCIKVDNKCYELKSLLNLTGNFGDEIVIHSIAVLFRDNTFFFSYKPALGDIEYIKVGVVDLPNGTSPGVLYLPTRVYNFDALYIDQASGVMYLGGSLGVYKLDTHTHRLTLFDRAQSDTVISLFYRNGTLYFVQASVGKIVSKQGDSYVPLLETNSPVRKFVITNDGSVVYVCSAGFMVARNNEVFKLSTNPFFRGLSIDLDGTVYAWWVDGIYKVVLANILNESKVVRVADISLIGAMTFDSSKSILFTSDKVLNKLSLTKFRKSATNFNTKNQVKDPDLCDSCIKVDNKCYELKSLLNLTGNFGDEIVIHSIAVLFRENKFFFSYEPVITDTEYLKVGFVDLPNGTSPGVLTLPVRVFNFDAIFIDQASGIMYLGGSLGVYKLDTHTHRLTPFDRAQSDTVISLFYRNGTLYFVQASVGKIVSKQGDSYVPLLETYSLVKRFVITNDGTVVYLCLEGLVVARNNEVFKLSTNRYFRGLAIDLDSTVYAWWVDGIYKVVLENILYESKVVKVADISLIGSMTFDSSNSILFTSDIVLNKLSLTKFRKC